MSETVEAPVKKPKGKMWKIFLVAVILVVIILGIFFGVFILSTRRGGPNPRVTSKIGWPAIDVNGDQVFYVDATVVNDGDDGYITIYAEISGPEIYEKKQQIIHLASGKSRTLHFKFVVFEGPSAPPIPPNITYEVWSVAS